MKKKICILTMALGLAISVNSAFSNKTISIPLNQPIIFKQGQVINWTSATSSDTLSVSAMNTFFVIHLSVSAASTSSINFSCGSSSTPVTVPAASDVICFINNGDSASWASSSSVAASGTYEILS